MPQMGPQLWVGVQIVATLAVISLLATYVSSPFLGTPPTPPGSSSLPWLW